MNVVSLFSGAGGLDMGFEAAGFNTIWANEFDKDMWSTYERNFPGTILDRRSIRDIKSDEVPDCDGIIGGPPCQSWSEAGSQRGLKDKKGQLFYEFTRILEDKKPKFFLAENVSGMMQKRNAGSLKFIKWLFAKSGYKLSFALLNANDYGVPQDRKRVFFIGIRKDLGLAFKFPTPRNHKLVLKNAIWDLGIPIPAIDKCWTNGEECRISNHEYVTGGFSPIYMSRNRVRSWDEPSFTIQASGRQIPIHPQAPKMHPVGKDKMAFSVGHLHAYRRLSIRECARIQTFPDEYVFLYDNLMKGYKMIGNAVPKNLAYHLANAINKQLNHGTT